jgi:hypothetical protein
VVQQARDVRLAALADLRQTLVELSEEDAAKKPTAVEWSVKETLAHLSLSERFTQRWFVDTIVGTTGSRFGGNPTVVPELLTMTLVAAPTLDALLLRLENDLEETLSIFSALRPEVVAMKARYRAMASALLQDSHIRDHLKQITATIEALKE